MFETVTEHFKEFVETGDTYLFLIPIYASLLIAERVTHHFIFREQKWNNGDTVANLLITVFNLGLNTVVSHLLPLAAMAYLYSWWSVIELPAGVVGWIAGFLLYDLAWYVDHRIAHRVGFLWAMHHVHHSSPEYNATVASRGFSLDITWLSRPTFYLLPILGITPVHFMIINTVTNIWGIAQHTRVIDRLGWLDKVLATPSNHRVHHASDEVYIDKNYGEVLIIWDHIFGTYEPEAHEPTYGVTTPIQTNNPLKIEIAGILWLLQKLSTASGATNKMLCLLMPPEWEPSSTAVETRKKHQESTAR